MHVNTEARETPRGSCFRLWQAQVAYNHTSVRDPDLLRRDHEEHVRTTAPGTRSAELRAG